jgi:rod shape-determining protein MreD
MRRAALSALLVGAALLLQLTVVNRLPLPGGGAPDLVLLVAIALALCGGAEAGMLTGFCAGLSLDLAPPAGQLVGEYALVFCIVGYGCGKLRGALGGSALLPLVAAAGAAAAAEALYAGLGLALDPAQVTWATVRQVLPSSVLYDVVISSPVVSLVQLAIRRVDARAGDGLPPRRGAGGPGQAGGAGLPGRARWPAGPRWPRVARNAATGRAPRLRVAAARRGDGWLGGRPPAWPAPAGRLGRRAEPRLRPGAGIAGSAARGSTASWSGGAGRGTVRRGAGPPPRNPRFRPAAGPRGGASGVGRPHRPAVRGRPVNLRLHSGRRRDAVVGGGMLTGRGLSGRRQAGPVRFRPGRTIGFGPGRMAGFRPGRTIGFGPRRAAGLRSGKSAGFRPGKSAGLRPGRAIGLGSGKTTGFRSGRAARLGSGRRAVPAIRAGGRASTRSNAWRIGSRRAGGS